MNKKQYIKSEFWAILLPTIILILMLYTANYFGWLNSNVTQFIVYSLLSVAASLFALMIRAKIMGKKRWF